ncbi:hypothetical protein DENSPDRAFT_926695 [Dentipellis sp. KUC8613]|nr:hypothetical protein DENSPDRAFT_926695 [Dentipellis sp. KUC8613]
MAAQVQSHNPLSDGGVDHGHVDPSGQSLVQALDPHLGLDSRQHYHSHYAPPPPHVLQPEHTQPHHTDHLFYPGPHDLPGQTVDRQQAQPQKRKQLETGYNGNAGKKRRQADTSFEPEDTEDGEGGDGDGGASGARHWTDDEKTKLFNWLMGPGEDEHFDALRTKKNTCFRECALDAFGGRKTFLAVKGCYERNFVVFKQIYSFETFTAQMQRGNVDTESEVDRVREYERRIYAARKAGFHVGNLSSRLLDHWHRMGWYGIFHSRWNGDPGIRRPTGRARTMGPPSANGMHPQNGESHIEPSLRGDTPIPIAGPSSHERQYEQESAASFVPQDETILSPPQTPGAGPSNQQHYDQAAHAYAMQPPHVPSAPMSAAPPPPAMPSAPEPGVANISAMAQSMVSACMRLLQAQAEDSKARLEYLKRREEREEEEGRLRREIEKKKQEREAADWERSQQNMKVKQKSELATELLSNPGVEATVKQAAGDYLKKLFAND